MHYSSSKPGTFYYACSSKFFELKLGAGEYLFLSRSCRLKFKAAKKRLSRKDVYIIFIAWDGGDGKSAGNKSTLLDMKLDSGSYSENTGVLDIEQYGCDGKRGTTTDCMEKCDGEKNSNAKKGW